MIDSWNEYKTHNTVIYYAIWVYCFIEETRFIPYDNQQFFQHKFLRIYTDEKLVTQDQIIKS
jgi:hypothetical protein